MIKEGRLIHQAGRAAGGTTISRILGYVRDMLVAQAFGAGLFADAFYAAFRIPNLLRRLLGEGSLSASFIPVFNHHLHTKNKEETQEFINVVFTALFLVLSIVTLLGIIFSPQLVRLIAWGFRDNPEKLELTIQLTRIMFPYLIFVCFAALALGILNTLGSFFLPSVAPASLSVSEILYVLVFVPFLTETNKVLGLALSVTVAGIIHFVIQYPRIKTFGYRFALRFNFKHEGLQKVGLLMLPALIGLSVDQINAFVNTICASFLVQGSVTALYYSNRLMQMPLAIFGIALASVSLPALSKHVALNDMDSFKNTLNYALRVIVFILLPSAAGLMVIGLPIIRILFEHGKFDYTASMLTYAALFCYAIGLPAYAGTKVLANAFYAYQNTKTPVKIAVFAMGLNVVLSVLLMKPFGVGGLAFATAISSWLNVFLLAVVLQKKASFIDFSSLLTTTLKSGAASLIMGGICYALSFVVFESGSFLGFLLSVSSGVAVYFLFSWLFKIKEARLILNIIHKQ